MTGETGAGGETREEPVDSRNKEPVIILEPGDERAQKIAKAIASRTAGQILQVLEEGPAPLSTISEMLEVPISGLTYHIANLLDAGVIEVAEERYSVKGRPVKFYALKKQILVVAPKKVDLKTMLLRYSSIFGIFVLGTLAVAVVARLLSPAPEPLLGGGRLEPVSAPPPAAPPDILAHDSTLLTVFLAGGILVIAMALFGEVLLAWWRAREQENIRD
ncbi:DNA-binding transcriptional ArsR family regulator [Methanolinea mesophila]|uniref:ArsR/SmtB family transcription factor n=1 Tax=Methanolinea mesophila TaxID=547055 RepID=UPI001AE76BAA|nr:helix-turn-helix domain-containing protein [Methanolinea mesophila]MBP1929454.1 DNA-binding transcriptional ArsR family regulator [Methanolinea mesophila]